jgi:hypothetical protein
MNIFIAYLIEPEQNAHQEKHADANDERGCHTGLNQPSLFWRKITLKRSFLMCRRISAFYLNSCFSGQLFPWYSLSINFDKKRYLPRN